jgi:hypothetical protein
VAELTIVDEVEAGVVLLTSQMTWGCGAGPEVTGLQPGRWSSSPLTGSATNEACSGQVCGKLTSSDAARAGHVEIVPLGLLARERQFSTAFSSTSCSQPFRKSP